jgi:hypothetical protein
MSYEHCDVHDEPATNGCASCLGKEVKDRVVALIGAAQRYANCPTNMALDELQAAAVSYAAVLLRF